MDRPEIGAITRTNFTIDHAERIRGFGAVLAGRTTAVVFALFESAGAV